VSITHAELITGIPGWLFDFDATAVKVYLALRSFERVPGKGCFPKIDTIASMVGCQRRATNNALRALRDGGAIVVVARTNKSNQYYFPESLQIARGAPKCTPARECTPGVHQNAHEDSYTDRDQEEVDIDLQEVELGTGLDSPSVSTAASGGGGLRLEEIQVVSQGLAQKRGHRTAPGEATGTRRNIFTAPESRPGSARASVTLERYRMPLDDPDLEQMAIDILELLDKLNVRHGGRPITPGSRPSQLTSSRLLVALDKVNVAETLDAVRWAFSEAPGASKWPKRIPKAYELRRHHHRLVEEFRKASVADITGEHPTPVPERQRTPEEQAALRVRLENHR
jgi:hypothetical protein